MQDYSIIEFMRTKKALQERVHELEREYGKAPFSLDTLDMIADDNGVRMEVSELAFVPLNSRHGAYPFVLIPPFAYRENFSHELCHILLDTDNELVCEYFSAKAGAVSVPRMLWSTIKETTRFMHEFRRKYNPEERMQIGARELERLAMKGYPRDVLATLADEYAQVLVPETTVEAQTQYRRILVAENSPAQI